MKRTTIFFITLLFSLTTFSQDIDFRIADGIRDNNVKTKIETNISLLLTEINAACAQERELRLNNINMALSGKYALQSLWKNLHFLCRCK